jgi:hypothetical protein
MTDALCTTWTQNCRSQHISTNMSLKHFALTKYLSQITSGLCFECNIIMFNISVVIVNFEWFMDCFILCSLVPILT